MTNYTVKCKPCGAVLATAPRVTEHILRVLRVHIAHECRRDRADVERAQAGEVLRHVSVEAPA